MIWFVCWRITLNPILEYRYKIPPFIYRTVDRIKRLSYEVLEKHKSKFGEDFADNKKVLDQISIIRSKGLKNEIAGYITKFIKNEIREENAKQAQAKSAQREVDTESKLEESNVEEIPSVEEMQAEDASTEAVIETPVTEDAPDPTEQPTETATEQPTETATENPRQ